MLLRTAHGSYEVHTMLCILHRVVQLGLGTFCRLSIHPQSLSRTSHLGVVSGDHSSLQCSQGARNQRIIGTPLSQSGVWVELWKLGSGSALGTQTRLHPPCTTTAFHESDSSHYKRYGLFTLFDHS